MKWGPMKISRIALLALVGLTGLWPAAPAHAGEPEWNRKVTQLITANYSYPRSAQLRGEQGSAKIKIAISATGKVLAVNLVQSSGSAILDREAVRIPMKVASFPPPPTHASIELTYPITFKIEE